MRKDILEFVERMKKEGIRPNYSEIARRYDCDYRTVKKYYEVEVYEKIKENIDNIIVDKRNEPVCAGDLTCIMLGY